MVVKYEKGSEWRKWDLHFHTPSSDDYTNKSINNQNIIDGLLQENIKAVAITDHNMIDIDRIDDLRSIAKDDVVIFPAIEIRTGAGTGENIHIIGIFSESLTRQHLEVIQRAFLSKGGLDKQRQDGKKEDELFMDINIAIEIIKENDGIVSIHAGHKHSGLETITNALPVSRAVKQEIAKTVDIFEMGKIEDLAEYREKVFPNLKFSRAMIICSDNHNITEYKFKTNLWIKADPTFKGLKQAILENEERIYVGEYPIELKYFNENKTKYIKSLSVNPTKDTLGNLGWFNADLNFNNNLIAIIGNKGSGKSALADIIGLAGNALIESEDFSFLNKKKFLDTKTGKAKNFQAEMQWYENNKNNTKNLNDPKDLDSVEYIKYLPQSYIEKLCSENNNILFQNEIQKVIFNNIPENSRLDMKSFDELIKIKVDAIKNKNQLYINDIQKINQQIIYKEKLLDPQYQNELFSKKTEQENNFKNLVKPDILTQPDNDTEEMIIHKKTIEDFVSQQAVLNDSIKSKDSEIALKLIEQNNLNNFREDLKTLSTSYGSILQKYSNLSKDFDVNLFSIYIENISQQYTNLKKTIDDLLQVKKENSDNLELILESISLTKDKLDEPNKKYQAYLLALQEYEVKCLEIRGDENDPKDGTINYLTNQISYVKNDVLKEKEVLIVQRIEKAKQLLIGIIEIKAVYEDIFAPLTKIINDKDNLKNLNMGFAASIKPEKFEENFYALIDRRFENSFSGQVGEDLLRQVLSSYDFNKVDDCISFVNIIENRLRFKDNSKPISIDNQIRNEKIDLYNFIWNFTYLQPKYSLTVDNKALEYLSPGERGMVLLVFYLFLDTDNRPIIIDQPEENLDNHTVTKILVPIIKEAKKQRQIFMVTHNPNIAVVCDAEQVIHATIDKTKNNTILYTSGSIENPVINRAISDVLEGTIVAFDNRNSKYFQNRK